MHGLFFFSPIARYQVIGKPVMILPQFFPICDLSTVTCPASIVFFVVHSDTVMLLCQFFVGIPIFLEPSTFPCKMRLLYESEKGVHGTTSSRSISSPGRRCLDVSAKLMPVLRHSACRCHRTERIRDVFLPSLSWLSLASFPSDHSLHYCPLWNNYAA